MARALLATRGLDSARHSGVIALFQQHFVKEGLIDVEVARAFPRSFEKRLNVDYADFSDITVDEAVRVRAEVAAFIDACATLLERTLEQSPRKG